MDQETDYLDKYVVTEIMYILWEVTLREVS